MKIPRGDPFSYGEGLTSTHSSHTPSASASLTTTTTTTTTTELTTTTTTTAFSSTLSRLISTLFPAVDQSSLNLTDPVVADPSTTTTTTTSGIFVVDGGGGGGGAVDVNTPLNAPEPSLDPVTDFPGQGLLGDSADLSDLGWIIPTTIVCIAAMLGIAFACFYGVRKLELRVLGWFYRNCSCCCAPGGGGEGRRLLRGEQYDTLSEETGKKGRRETVRLRGKVYCRGLGFVVVVMVVVVRRAGKGWGGVEGPCWGGLDQ